MSVIPVIDEEKVKNLLDTMLKTIQTEANPQALNQYRALIRKNVPFFRRSYLAAYLLMLQEQPQNRQRRFGGGDRLRGRPNGAAPSGGADPVRQGQRPGLPIPAPVALPEEESIQLFMNIGRNRRVFPREILGLIYAKTSVSREDIGIITIMNNYSFVQVRKSVAVELMETLNGISFRGKILAVNYARTRNEDEENPEEPALKLPEQDASPIDDVPTDDVAIDDVAYDEADVSEAESDDAGGNGDDVDDPMDMNDSGEAAIE
jgi:hypothetical protein